MKHPTIAHDARTLEGRWKSPGLQIVFKAPLERGTVKLSGVTDEPFECMDYILHEVDGELWIKFQNNAGEKNYKITLITKDELVLENNGENIRLKRTKL